MRMRAGLVALVLLAGCGGSDSTDKEPQATATATREASAGDTMSAAAWSQKVEAICARTEAAATKAGKQLGRRSAAAGDSKQELAYKVLRLQAKLVDPWMDKIEALPKPEGREQAATKFVATMRDIGDVLARTATAIKQNDEANGKELVKQLQTKTLSVRSQARTLNIEKCNPSANGSGS